MLGALLSLETLQGQEQSNGCELSPGVPGISCVATGPVFWAGTCFPPSVPWVVGGVRREEASQMK